MVGIAPTSSNTSSHFKFFLLEATYTVVTAIVMSCAEGRNRISFPPTRFIRNFSLLSSPEYIRTESLAASVRSVGTALRDSLDDIDPGCLITNIHRHSDERAHMANAQRTDPQEKRDVERLLIDLGLAPQGFDLDGISNIVWLDATLHKAFDFYDLLAITISLDYGKDIIAFLEADLSYRQEVMNATGQLQPRNFQYFRKPELQLVVLHPKHLLPCGSTLLRRNLDGSYTPYKAASDQLLREVDSASILSSDPPDSRAQPFPTFFHETKRDLIQTLNIYLVLLNAETKFQRFAKNIGLDKLHPDMRAVVDCTMRIVDLMYSQPVRSAAYRVVRVSVQDEFSMRPHAQREVVNNAEAEDEDRMEPGGAQSNATGQMEEREPPPFSWDTLSHEERKALGRDLLSRGSAFRHPAAEDSTTEDSTAEDVSRDYSPDSTQGTRPLLPPVAPHHKNQYIGDWAEGIE